VKKSRFSEEQIVGILKESEAGENARVFPQAWHQFSNVVRLEVEVPNFTVR
jgi:hypothetical protein